MKKETVSQTDKSSINSAEINKLTKPESQFYPITSIADAENRMELMRSKDVAEHILACLEADSKRLEGRTIFGSADEYHNLASEFGRRRLYNGAEIIATYGVALYKFNVDLLADIVKFGSQAQDWESCRKAFERLIAINRKQWNWRTFSFVIDYLMCLFDVTPEGERNDVEKNIITLVKEYKKLNDERAWLAESEYYLYKGCREKAMFTLKDAIKKVKVVPSVCLKLADLLLESGEYEEVIEIAAAGIRSSAQDQPSVNTGYLVYVSALAKDALIHEEDLHSEGQSNSGFRNKEKVAAALKEYGIAQRLLNRKVYLDNIRQRVLILEQKSGLKGNMSIIEYESVNDV